MKKKNEISIRSSAAEYLTFVASTGDNPQSVEMRYEDENIWLTQKNELAEEATIRDFRIVQMIINLRFFPNQ
jgi:hypothetical protein